MEFSSQEYCSCHFLLHGIFPTHGLNPCLLCRQSLAGVFFITEPPGKPIWCISQHWKGMVYLFKWLSCFRTLLSDHSPGSHWKQADQPSGNRCALMAAESEKQSTGILAALSSSHFITQQRRLARTQPLCWWPEGKSVLRAGISRMLYAV